MQIPAKISFHNMDHSPALESRIKEKIARLSERFSGIIRCQVTIEGAPHHKNKGNTYNLHILVTLPGGEKVVSHHPGKSPVRHEKPFAAMNDAFKAITKQLAHFKNNQRGEVKGHTSVLLDGKVVGLDLGQEFGFIALEDGSEFYFHKNAVHGDRYLELKEGSKVRFSFIEGEGAEGPQANFVRLVR
jgi:cold shock CspA family protein/ribosome-associated translation inhibitor RaiA